MMINLMTWVIIILLGVMFVSLVGKCSQNILDDPYRAWANEKDKLCWEKEGDFKVSKYGVRCTNMSGGIIFNETFRPKEDKSK